MDIQRKPYDWMYRFTPQREWIEKRGVMLWLAFFFLELGAGTFIVGSVFGNLRVISIGWLICALGGGGFHLLYLGQPFRFWRILLSSGWKTSWISRGLFFVTWFLLLGLINIALTRWASSPPGLLVAADIFAFLAIIYCGFAMSYVNAIPLWNTTLLPVLYVVLGIWGGLGVTLIVTAASGSVMVGAEEWSRLFLIAFVFIVFIYLFGVRYQVAAGKNSTVKTSVREIVTGKGAPLFWIMVVLLGMAFPLGVVISSWVGNMATPVALLYTAIIFELLGDLALRYSILRNGLYSPLLPL